jgi:uncharacterized protein YukE
MNRRTLLFVAALALAAAVSVPEMARAQGGAAGQGAPAGDATTPAAVPAQSNTSATANANGTSSAITTAKAAPAKKVWTNEDMGDVHKNSVISTFSATSSKPGNTKAAGNAKSGNAKQYQDQITKLQAKLPPLDEQIAELQATLNGTAVNSTRHYSGTKIDDWHEELVQLQKQREDITAKISALQDEARRNGVPPNQIPE